MAKKRKKRQPFGNQVDRKRVKRPATEFEPVDQNGGVFAFFRDFGVRETIESIIVAIILAMLFRGFEAEAFIIPTGSMAPSLQGQHMDLECEHCGYRYRTGASLAGASFNYQDQVESTFCPICRYETKMRSKSVADHRSNNGDRILVNKFIYDAQPPERYDVIVFKNPNNGKQNYIKRLVGMPGDNLLIENGDIYTMDLVDGELDKWKKTITRKPYDVLLAVMQVVDDTDYIGPQLQAVEWPLRWNSWSDEGSVEPQMTRGVPAYHFDAGENAQMIRYRHLVPLKDEWSMIEKGTLPPRMSGDNFPTGRLIGDYYSYNDRKYRRRGSDFSPSLHWVGDLGLEASIEVESTEGTILLDVVEGGAHFKCEIDVKSGEAKLRCNDPDVQFVDPKGAQVQTPDGQSNLKGPGEYDIRFVNADDRVCLWIDDQLVEFDASEYVRSEIPVPTWSEEDAGDAEPLGVGVVNAKMTVNRLIVLRDVYYTSVKGGTPGAGQLANEASVNPNDLVRLHMSPELWSNPSSIEVFKLEKQHDRPMFKLLDFDEPELDQFLPCGDNSPASLDGRVWEGPKHVNREMLIGRAMFIYWPHAKNKPIPYFPNFENMKFIR